MATCPLTQFSGFPCENESDPRSLYDLCTEHWAEIIEDHKRSADIEHHLLAEVGCPVCKHTILAGPGVPVSCPNPHCWADAWWEQPLPDADTPARRGTEWIYYLLFGDRIKIGTSSNVKARLSTLPHDAILALEPGSYSLERQRHTEFAVFLILGQREWFQDHVAIRDHTEDLRREHGMPADLLRRNP